MIVNGEVVATRTLEADGELRDFKIPVELTESSWVAVRILPSVHTNPIFVHIDGRPIHASRRSAEWCVKAVETCWNSKQGQIRQSEQAAARKAYDEAKAVYQEIADKLK